MTEHELTESQLVGSRIRDARINRRMSQADLAAKANISLPHVSNIEKGKTSMKLETFIRIIEALQVSADSLLRPDVPEVRSLYQSEFDELLADCSPKELDSILKIVRELKSTMADGMTIPEKLRAGIAGSLLFFSSIDQKSRC